MTPQKAEKEFRWMFEETRASERSVRDDQKLLGDACARLREAYGIPRNALAPWLRMDSMQIALWEYSCSTEQANQYRAAVWALKKAYSPAATAKPIRNPQRLRAGNHAGVGFGGAATPIRNPERLRAGKQ